MSNEALEVPMSEQPADRVPIVPDEQPATPATNFDFSLIDNPTSDPSENVGLLTVKTTNKWIDDAKRRPTPKMLFDCLWYEGELCILFADTNLGKSVLAVQIADAISKGEAIQGFRLEAPAQPVIYLDFELSDKQLEARCSNNFAEHRMFSDNFLRAEINPDSDIPDNMDFEELLNQSIEQAIANTGAKVLIVDNLTYLRHGTETAKDALPLMKSLKEWKRKFGISILALAHTPKRVLSNPITRNDLQGSKMLINFCDSAFAIGESFRDKHLRYIKQIKQRNCVSMYDSNNVVVCELTNPDNLVQFVFQDYGKEADHLRVFDDEERDNLVEQVRGMSEQGMSQRAIAKELKISPSVVNKYLKQKQ